MPKWFGSRSGSGVDAAVPREWRTALEQLLAPLDDQGSGPGRSPAGKHLARSARDYVLTGEPVSVLQAVQGTANHQLVFHLWASHRFDDRAAVARTLCARMGAVPPEVGVRLGRVIEASSAHGHGLGQPAHLRWAEAMLVSFLHAITSGDRSREARIPLGIGLLEAMLASTGRSGAELVAAAFRSTGAPSYYGHGQFRRALRSLEGYAEAVAHHADAIRPAFAQPKVDDRLVVLEMLAGLPTSAVQPFAAELAEYATGTSSQVRAASYGPLQACGPAAVAPLQEIARQGRPAARLEALVLLRAMTDPALQEWALETAGEDRAASVRALVEQWTAPGDEAEAEQPVLRVVEVPDITWPTEASARTVAALEGMVADTNQLLEGYNTARRRSAEQWRAKYGSAPSGFAPTPLVGRGIVDDVVAALRAGRPPQVRASQWGDESYYLARALPGRQLELGLDPAGLTVLLARLGLLKTSGHRESMHPAAVAAYDLLHETTGRPTALEIATMLDLAGIDGSVRVLDALLVDGMGRLGAGWPDEDIAPFALLHLDTIVGHLDPNRESVWYVEPDGVFRVLATLPSMPRTVVDALFAIALGTRKTQRRGAQDALAGVPGVEARIMTALSDGKGEVRALAAQWLGRLRHAPAVPALEAAVAKEKQDVAMGAMLDALQALGQPVEKYLDRDALAAQAATAVAKGLPKDLEWFPWAGLPTVRWADGDVVPLTTLQWFLAQAVRGRTAEPNAVLRKYAAMLDPRDREELGQFVLEAWIGQDLAPIDAEDARTQAETAARQHHNAIRQWPDHYRDDPLRNATLDQIVAAFLPNFLKQPAGSASASKGVLAVAAACAGERAAGVVQRYLKEWYGMRAAQGRALIVMLAWIEHPSATQLMLSVGSRFRTKGFQDEATKQAELLAERKGWTVGELADRTIPTAGFDEAGELELSYGERRFTARLLPDLDVELRSPEGKVVKALPAPRQSDDEDAAKQAKKSLATAKKELKAVTTLQAERLYEALCTGRGWAYEDWDRYLRRHPVMRHLTQRLAWAAVVGDDVRVFRPLDDGTLTDVEDEQVTVPAGARVVVAHDSVVDADQVAAWQEHFSDYEVSPLFQQFGKGTHALAEGQERATEVTDFRGHLVESFALRGRAGKLGYTRGETMDAGWFYSYDKRFPTLGITAQVEFSGNGLPETNRTVALKGLSFQRHGSRGGSNAMRLSEVPAILLSEAWNDVRLMAADGPGFDPDWEKTVENW